MELAIGILIVAVAVSLTLGRMFLKRNEWVDEKPKPKQQRTIEQFEPERATPSIEDLIEEEAADLGLNKIPGGDGIETSVKLRVWHRDGSVRSGCSDDSLRYEVDAGVDPAEADLSQVRLLCRPTHNGSVEADEPAAAANGAHADTSDGGRTDIE